MRSDKQIKELVDNGVEVTGGIMPMTILAHSEAEAESIRAAMKGRQKVKSLSVRVAAPDEFISTMEKARGY